MIIIIADLKTYLRNKLISALTQHGLTCQKTDYRA